MVNYQQKIKILKVYLYKIVKYKLARIIIYFCLISSLCVYVNSTDEQDENDSLKSIQDENVDEHESSAKLIYNVDKNLATLKNPFSFAHEERTARVINDATQKDKNSIKEEVVSSKKVEEKAKDNKNEEFKQSKKSSATKIYRLKAVLNFGQNPMALLSIDDKIYRVHQGEQIASLKILSIEQTKLVLQQADGSVVNCLLMTQ